MRRSRPSRESLAVLLLLLTITSARADESQVGAGQVGAGQVGAGQVRTGQVKTSDAKPVAMANPASVFCGERGGKVVIETAESGAQSGFCLFPDGTRVNEWAYFRSNHRTTH